jgi:hypothetical protein
LAGVVKRRRPEKWRGSAERAKHLLPTLQERNPALSAKAFSVIVRGKCSDIVDSRKVNNYLQGKNMLFSTISYAGMALSVSC